MIDLDSVLVPMSSSNLFVTVHCIMCLTTLGFADTWQTCVLYQKYTCLPRQLSSTVTALELAPQA